jgi:hypothetical protein
MGRLSTAIRRATTLPSTYQLRRTQAWISGIANVAFLLWFWRFVCLEAFRYIRAKGLTGVGSDGVARIKKASNDYRRSRAFYLMLIPM